MNQELKDEIEQFLEESIIDDMGYDVEKEPIEELRNSILVHSQKAEELLKKLRSL